MMNKPLPLFRVTLVCVLVMVLGGVTGCKKKSANLTPQQMGSDKEIYEQAKSKIKRDPERARLLFKEIMHLYPDSIYARRAKIGIADSYFRQRDSASYIMAATEYQEYVNLYPNSPDAVYAKSQIAMCYYRQMRKPGRDQSNTHLAFKALESLIKQYPETNEAKEAREKINGIRQRLATHYFEIGLSNFKLRTYPGAIARFKQVIDDYPDFEQKDKLFFYTGKCYFVMRNYSASASFFRKIVNSFPKSKYLDKTAAMLKRVEALEAVGAGNKKDNTEKKTRPGEASAAQTDAKAEKEGDKE